MSHARPIGNHGIYVIDPATPRQIIIAPTTEPLTPGQLAILRTRPTSVAEPDLDEFIANYLPHLQECIDVTSPDKTVTLPPPPPPILIVSVTHAPKHTPA